MLFMVLRFSRGNFDIRIHKSLVCQQSRFQLQQSFSCGFKIGSSAHSMCVEIPWLGRFILIHCQISRQIGIFINMITGVIKYHNFIIFHSDILWFLFYKRFVSRLTWIGSNLSRLTNCRPENGQSNSTGFQNRIICPPQQIVWIT